MPPKIRITKKDIIGAALNAVRRDGEAGLNARAIAVLLGCSTQPVFSNFSSMEELKAATAIAAYEVYEGFIAREVESGKYPPYKAFGMAYIAFAKEERELFKLLFMCDRSEKSFTPTSDFDASVEMIMQANGISKEKAELLHLEIWTFTHGIATMLATSFLELESELVSRMLTDAYQGIRARLLSEEKEK